MTNKRPYYKAYFFVHLLALLLVYLSPLYSQAETAWDLYVENDSNILGGPGTDSSYTNGIKLSYIYSSKKVPFWARLHSHFFEAIGVIDDSPTLNYSLALGHQLFTPSNTRKSELIRDDRPYAGWLYTSLAAAIKDISTAHYFDFNIGIIGPSSKGEEVQKNFHKTIGSEIPQGWNNQLADEVTLQAFYQQRKKWLRKRLFGNIHLDLIPFWDIALGNVTIATGGGLMFRSGYHLPDDFGPSRPSSSESQTILSDQNEKFKKLSFFVFGGGTGRAIAHNIFLDGNSFKSSHSVTPIPLVGEHEVGFQVGYLPIEFQWRYVTRSPEFKERRDHHSFASASIRFHSEF